MTMAQAKQSVFVRSKSDIEQLNIYCGVQVEHQASLTKAKTTWMNVVSVKRTAWLLDRLESNDNIIHPRS